jgi:hypothetical protein
MSAPLDDIASYSAFVYSLAERHSFVTNSTLALAPIGATLATADYLASGGWTPHSQWQ